MDVIYSCSLQVNEILKLIQTLEDKYSTSLQATELKEFTEIKLTLKSCKDSLLNYIPLLTTSPQFPFSSASITSTPTFLPLQSSSTDSSNNNNSNSNSNSSSNSSIISENCTNINSSISQNSSSSSTTSVSSTSSFDLLLYSINLLSLTPLQSLLSNFLTSPSLSRAPTSSPPFLSSFTSLKISLLKIDLRLKLKLDQILILYPLSPSNSSSSSSSSSSTNSNSLLSLLPTASQTFWLQSFPHSSHSIPFPIFCSHLNSYLTRIYSSSPSSKLSLSINHSKIRSTILREYLDLGEDGMVSIWEFSIFLKLWGPFPNCISNMVRAVGGKHVNGWTSGYEAEQLVKNKGKGGYVVRFSKTKVGSYAVTFVDSKGGVKHVHLYGCGGEEGGVTLQIPPNVYKGVTEFVEDNKEKLKSVCSEVGFSVEEWNKEEEENEKEKEKEREKEREKENGSEGGKGENGKGVDGLCVVCMDRRVRVVFLECAHVVCCEECSKKLKLCPICRKVIARSIVIYM
eukprot:TRINITY_DN903_c2_g1_i1.p1 TRINITY_DN903_c2_g1~~TRINITY_DN903_c2_g1_i1.p1  ORF type:complete len:512 (+),score=159.39 TRINITY_DN903_c2_g1_i1:34-1569(+)